MRKRWSLVCRSKVDFKRKRGPYGETEGEEFPNAYKRRKRRLCAELMGTNGSSIRGKDMGTREIGGMTDSNRILISLCGNDRAEYNLDSKKGEEREVLEREWSMTR